MNAVQKIRKRTEPFQLALAIALIGITGFFDLLTGYEIAFSLFYLIPIYWITWIRGREWGIIAALLSALVWFAADMAAGHSYADAAVLVWNALLLLTLFVIFTFLFSALRNAFRRESELAHTDGLTGAVNVRLFNELAQVDLDRLQRFGRAFTLAYLDLDNFKAVNDQYGHAMGDKALSTIVRFFQDHLRKIDVVARLGGDEFALLLPETNQESARVVIPKLQAGLLETMRQNNWPITFSTGVLTCNAAPPSIDELVRKADALMYSVKQAGKNAIQYQTYEG
jgi:diguanylate cyclase (GGDEF)-like protein